MEKHALGVRKGAWTKEEDILLRKCIEKYGEGRWHLVPLRAGLNRCRKSCRLRWLNYLRPNIKRGYFTKDEVDLIVRLHKLLGNRWSLIAGRIPGRTANDVKNFWNTHMDKRSSSAGREIKCRRRKNTLSITESNIIRPRPRTFSQKQQAPAATFPREKKSLITQTLNDEENRQPSNAIVSENESTYKQAPSDQLVPEEVDECMRWWGNLLEINENENGAVPFLFPEDDQDHDSVMDPMMIISSPGELNNDAVGDDGMSSLDLDDVDVWQLVGMDMQ